MDNKRNKMKNKTPEQIEIVQVDNGYIVYIGANCSSVRDRYIFQSFTELVIFLDKHFTHRSENIISDYPNQLAITLNK
jgi:hypothetical protein